MHTPMRSDFEQNIIPMCAEWNFIALAKKNKKKIQQNKNRKNSKKKTKKKFEKNERRKKKNQKFLPP